MLAYSNVGQMGWPNELSVRLPLWDIGGFELTGANPDQVKPMTLKMYTYHFLARRSALLR